MPLTEYLALINDEITPEDEVIMMQIPDEVYEQMAESEDLNEFLNYIPDETRTEEEVVPDIETPQEVTTAETEKEITDEKPIERERTKEVVPDGVEVAEKPKYIKSQKGLFIAKKREFDPDGKIKILGNGVKTILNNYPVHTKMGKIEGIFKKYGFDHVEFNKSKTTNSYYIDTGITDDDILVEIRVSNHSKAYYGNNVPIPFVEMDFKEALREKSELEYRIEADVYTKESIEYLENSLNEILSSIKKREIKEEKVKPLKQAEKEVDTNPSEAQIEAGNYKKGHTTIQGMEITIENPKGSVREGTDEEGKRWKTKLNNTYGYFKRTKGKDGDQIDVFIGDNLESDKIFVVDQNNPDGSFDESKVMMGFNSIKEAKDAYLSNYSKGWQGLGKITYSPLNTFKEWMGGGSRQTKPYFQYKMVKEIDEKVAGLPKDDIVIPKKEKIKPEKTFAKEKYTAIEKTDTDAFTELDDEGDLVVRIDKIEVDKKDRQKGIGRKEVGNIIKWAEKKGAKEVVIESERDAIPFWEKIGFDILDQGSSISTGVFEIKKPVSAKVAHTEKPVALESAQSIDELQQLLAEGKVKKDKAYDERMEELRRLEPRFKGKEIKPFYSPTEKALQSIKQEKATPEQWKAMLLKNGAKQAELDWMGFDEFIKGKKSLTKADIQDFVDQNKIEVEDVVKEGGVGYELGEYESVVLEGDTWYVTFENGAQVSVDTSEAIDEEDAINEARSKYESSPGDYSTDFGETKFSKYQLPGGENYKEVLLTMPSNLNQKDFNNLKDALKFEKEVNGTLITNTDGTHTVEFGKKEKFKSSHFDEPNILAHVRFNERTDSDGNKVLFIEELQSDWAQKGRSKGFLDPKKKKEYDDAVKKASDYYNEVLDDIKDEDIKTKYNPTYKTYEIVNPNGTTTGIYNSKVDAIKEGKQKIAENDPTYLDLKEKANKLSGFKYGVPQMPFKTTPQWVNLALRRMIRYASEKGFDRIAWTTGEQQAERYDLSKQVDQIVVEKDGDKYFVSASPKSETTEFEFAEPEEIGIYSDDELPGIIGKDLAEKAISEGGGRFQDTDLKIGGEGMKSFYDKILPNLANKIGKKFGAKVETVDFGNFEKWYNDNRSKNDPTWEEYQKLSNDQQEEYVDAYREELTADNKISEQMSLPITDQMYKTAIGEGFPLFKKPSDFETIPEYQEYRKGKIAENLKITQNLAKDIGKKLGVKVNVVEYHNELPQQIKRAFSKQGLTKTYGVYDPTDGEVYLVAYNLEGDPKLITETALHEVVGHKGLWNLLGSEGNDVLDLIWKGMGKADQKSYLDAHGTERLAAEEFFAETAEENKENNWYGNIIAKIRDIIRKLFPNLRYNRNDILDLLKRSRQALKKDAKVKEGEVRLKEVDQIETKEFKNWFGDSKVVDDKGNPLVVYHGTTTEDISKFVPYGKQTVEAVFFTNDKRTAKTYGEELFEVYLSIKDPLIEDFEGKSFHDDGVSQRFNYVLNEAKRRGYDGFIAKNISDPLGEADISRPSDVYVVFDPTQIKSATENIGAFDPESADIRFKADEVKPTRIEKKEAELKEKISEFKRTTESITNHKQLRNKITALKAGYKMGILDERTSVKNVQDEIVRYAKKYMPLAEAGKRDVGKLLTMVKNTQVPSKLEEIFNKIDEITTGIQRKKTINKIDDTLKRTEVKKVSGKIQGKLSPDTQTAIEKIRAIRKLKNTDEYIDNLEENDVEDIALFSVFGNLKDKSKAEIDKANDILTELVTTGKIWYKSEIEKRKKYQKELRDKVVDKITGGKGLTEAQDIKAEGKKIGGWFSDRFINKNQSFEWLMDVISQDKTEKTGQGWMQDHFGDILNKATNEETKNHRKYIEILNDKASEIFGKEKSALAKKLSENARQVEKSGVTYVKDGKRIELPLSQNEAYKKWMELQDPKLTNTFDRMGWDETTINQLDNFIKPDVKKWAEWQLNEFYPEYYKTVNKEYRDNYFVDLPFNEKYSPITREVTDVKDTDDPLLKNTRTLSSVGNASLKSRVSNVNPLAFKDGDNVLANHLAQMEHFKAWVAPMRELRSVFSSRPVQHALKFEHGNSVRNTINAQIDDFARGGIDRSLVISAIDKIRRNFVTAELGLNYGLLPKQLVSSFTYMADIPISDYMKGMSDFIANPVKVVNTLKKSELIKDRYKSGWTHEVESAMKSLAPETLAGTKTKFQQLRNILMLPTKLGDRFAIFAGWPVYKYYYDQKIKEGASVETAEEYAMNKFERVASRSQQSAKLKDTSQLQKGSLGKLFTMFHNSQQQYFRYEIAALRNLSKGRGNTAHNLKILAVTHFLLPILFQLVSNWFTDEDEKTEKKRLIRAAILGSWNGLLIAGDIMEYGLEKLFGEKWGYTPSPVFGSVENMGYGLAMIAKGIKDVDSEVFIKGVDNLAHAISQTVLGAPYRPAKKLIKEVRETIDPDLKLESDYKKSVKESLNEVKEFNKAKKEKNISDANRIFNSPTFEKSKEIYYKNNLIKKWAKEIKDLEEKEQTDLVIEGIKRKTEMRNNLMKELIEKTK
jgi:hypothetical protein